MFKYYDKNGSFMRDTNDYKRAKELCYEFGGSVRMADGTILFSIGC